MTKPGYFNLHPNQAFVGFLKKDAKSKSGFQIGSSINPANRLKGAQDFVIKNACFAPIFPPKSSNLSHLGIGRCPTLYYIGPSARSNLKIKLIHLHLIIPKNSPPTGGFIFRDFSRIIFSLFTIFKKFFLAFKTNPYLCTQFIHKQQNNR
jgi:hypothetical protein